MIMAISEKTRIKNKVCISVLVVGILLIIASFCVPPLGVIDNSVLAAIGEVFTFTAAFTGIDSFTSTAIMKYRGLRETQEEPAEA